ncbi:hypothetical protein [Nitrosomonas mobilis]|uniref:Transmembrane protein n=1 Tax=Nitrosomonas mobilis TaxID=51642 RepID=A0A1G5SDL0_9PROT|nr:hypothetical protein [Nitrosomonas mobilis]SCZ84499.1 membrane hypothetical protein [Nitrosomonas mobilis]
MQEHTTDRLWQHALHEDNLFNSRLGGFLTFQSLLLATSGLVINANVGQVASFVIFLCVVGIALSGIWFFILLRQSRNIDILVSRCREAYPEFRETTDLMYAGLLGRYLKAPTVSVMIPVLVMVIWIGLFVYSGTFVADDSGIESNTATEPDA